MLSNIAEAPKVALLEKRGRIATKLRELMLENDAEQQRINERQQRIDEYCLELKECNDVIAVILNHMSEPELAIDDVINDKSVLHKPCSESALPSAEPYDRKDLNKVLTFPESKERFTSNDLLKRSLRLEYASSASVDGQHESLGKARISPSNAFERIDCNDFDQQMNLVIKGEPVIISNARPTLAEQMQPVRFFSVSMNVVTNPIAEGSRDIGADVNAIGESLARRQGAYFSRSHEPVLLKPFANCGDKVETRLHAWLPLVFLGDDQLYWVEFCVFPDGVMEENQCIFSVKTCVKASLVLDGQEFRALMSKIKPRSE